MKTICIAGKNDIAVNVLLHCINTYSDINIVVVCNRNDSGKNGWQRSLLWHAKRYNVRVLKLDEVYGIEDLIFMSLEFDRIIRPERFSSTKLYNIHFSLLPMYKGCHTSVLPILHGKDKTGVTFHRIDNGIDTGAIIDQKEVKIDSLDTSYDLYKKLIITGTELVIKNISDVINGIERSSEQKVWGSTYYSISEIDYGHISLEVNATAFQIQNQIRAFGFRPYQLLKWNESYYIECVVLDKRSKEKPGTIIEDTEFYTIVSSIDYAVKLYKDVLDKLLLAIKNGQNNYAIKLCESDKIINAQEEHGWSPLIVAVFHDNIQMVEFLLSRGADIHVKNWNGTTLLMYAKDAGINTNDWTLFRKLSLELDIGERDYSGLSLIDYVLSSKEARAVPDDIKRLLD